MKTIRTRDQKRAELVFENIRLLTENEPELGPKYGTLALNAPTFIRISGLIQVLAFYTSKKEQHHQLFMEHLTQELGDMQIIAKTCTDLLDFATTCDLVHYMHLTDEVLALTQWHKRFAQSVLKAETGGDA
ncbi:MAG: type III-B CRISPR module-associated protein Cmr5 [Desulfoplanes sp.]